MCDMEEYSSILSCPSRKPLDANYIMVSSAILSALSDYHIGFEFTLFFISQAGLFRAAGNQN
jgi:hypothetical protein